MEARVRNNKQGMDKETKEFIKSEIADLAQMITRSFDGLNHQIDARFAKVDERFGQVERDLGEVKETVERIDRRTQNQVDAVYEDVSDLQKRVERLEAKVY
jgi:ubiquinone biosynthesis protein UbiJ